MNIPFANDLMKYFNETVSLYSFQDLEELWQFMVYYIVSIVYNYVV